MDDTINKKGDLKPTGRRYSSVEELIRGERMPTDISEGVKTLAEETRTTRALAAMRARAGLTQQEVGEKMTPPRTQSAISKLESGRDEDLTLGDVRDYAKVLNERIGILFGPQLNHVEAIKLHAEAMRHHMLALAKLAHEDGQLEKEIQAFFGEAFFNILTILATCQHQMPEKGAFEFRMQLLGPTGTVQQKLSKTAKPSLVG